jgi:dUTP pyrophosphatase
MELCFQDQNVLGFYQDRNSTSGNSGYDLFVPEDVIVQPGQTLFLDHRVSARTICGSGFYLYPRSSISRTPLRLVNSVGIIDPNYRGGLIAAVQNTGSEPYIIQRGQRLVQVCLPDLRPFRVFFVDGLDETARGGAGFGSSGL